MDLKQRPGWEDFLDHARMMFFEKATPTSMGEGVQAVAAWAYETGRSDATRDALVRGVVTLEHGDSLVFVLNQSATHAEVAELRERLMQALPGVVMHVVPVPGPTAVIRRPAGSPDGRPVEARVISHGFPVAEGTCLYCGSPVTFNLAAGFVQHTEPNDSCPTPWPAMPGQGQQPRTPGGGQ